uniref:Exonuclease domain-containing protein n=1 Tax=Oryza meridionalis TaxID=40149 RepID=A0A0E0DC84_9ORYZ
MSKLANMFSVLNLDAEDDREEAAEPPTSSKAEAAAVTSSTETDKIRLNHTMIVNHDGENLASSSSDYDKPLVWIDLEMTGLDITKDRILEIACIITDGLKEKVLQSDISENDAEKQVLDFIRKYIGSATPLIAGNSVYMDLLFLKKYMPHLAAIFSHVIVDVSSISALCSRWFPKERKHAPRKEKNHRAMDDIRESIKELQYYKENIFKSRKSKCRG